MCDRIGDRRSSWDKHNLTDSLGPIRSVGIDLLNKNRPNGGKVIRSREGIRDVGTRHRLPTFEEQFLSERQPNAHGHSTNNLTLHTDGVYGYTRVVHRYGINDLHLAGLSIHFDFYGLNSKRIRTRDVCYTGFAIDGVDS
jgi:hypothetical protein